MTPAEAVEAIRALDPGDPERAHSELDQILLTLVPDEVAAAAGELVGACNWWACA